MAARAYHAAVKGLGALEILQRYPLYFERPAFARECASTLAA
jgi:hypothetical protein